MFRSLRQPLHQKLQRQIVEEGGEEDVVAEMVVEAEEMVPVDVAVARQAHLP